MPILNYLSITTPRSKAQLANASGLKYRVVERELEALIASEIVRPYGQGYVLTPNWKSKKQLPVQPRKTSTRQPKRQARQLKSAPTDHLKPTGTKTVKPPKTDWQQLPQEQINELLQRIFDQIKLDQEECVKCTVVDISLKTGISRSNCRGLCETLVTHKLIVTLRGGWAGTVTYRIHPRAADCTDVGEWVASGRGLSGRRYFDLWVANHRLVGQIPYSVSQQGLEAMRGWLMEQDSRGAGRVA